MLIDLRKLIRKLMVLCLMQKAGKHLARKLRKLMRRSRSIEDVRGLGHFWAVELVKDRETKEPFDTKADKVALRPLMVDFLAAEMLKRGSIWPVGITTSSSSHP